MGDVHYGNDKCWVCGKPNINGLGGMRLCEEHKGMDPANPWKESQDKIAELTAEVERLRPLEAELAAVTLAAQGEDVDAPKSDALKAVLAVRANMERLRAENAAYRKCRHDLWDQVDKLKAKCDKLEAENAELRASERMKEGT